MTHDLQESDIFALLAKRRRRLTLRILRERPTPLPAADLASQLASLEYERPSAEEKRTIYLTLYHDHLPRLDEAAVLQYDPTEGIIHPGNNFETVIRVLEEVTEEELPWSES